MASLLIFLLVPALAQRWVPIRHEHTNPSVDTGVLGNLKETKVLEKTLGQLGQVHLEPLWVVFRTIC